MFISSRLFRYLLVLSPANPSNFHIANVCFCVTFMRVNSLIFSIFSSQCSRELCQVAADPLVHTVPQRRLHQRLLRLHQDNTRYWTPTHMLTIDNLTLIMRCTRTAYEYEYECITYESCPPLSKRLDETLLSYIVAVFCSPCMYILKVLLVRIIMRYLTSLSTQVLESSSGTRRALGWFRTCCPLPWPDRTQSTYCLRGQRSVKCIM